MIKQALLTLLIAILALASLPAWGESLPEKLGITVRLMGNGEYLFLAAEVDDPNIIGTNTEPMSQPWNDDCIDFYLDTSGQATSLGPTCFRLAISAAGEGGFSALVGDELGSWRPNNAWMAGLKYDVGRTGTLNKPSDIDQRWVVEVAIPWRFLGGVPPDNSALGFNVVCHVRGENDTWVSWSSKCKIEDDLANPAAWGKMVVRYSGEYSLAQNDVCTCPMGPYPAIINARLTGNEWMVSSVIAFDKPAPQYVSMAAPSRAGRAPLLMALYRCDYQGDPALPGAGRALWDEKGNSLLAEHPREGVGPLFSGLREDWHHAQAAEARRAGLDALLAVWPSRQQDAAWATSGLGALVAASRQLFLEGRSHPLLAPYLELSGLAGLDLAADPGPLYRLLWQYFSLVPPDLRLQLDPSSTGGQPTYVVVLAAPTGIANWNELTFAALRSSFARDFAAHLALVLHPDWREKAPQAADGLCSLGGGELYFDQSCRLAVATLSPGCAHPLRARMGGRSYEADWLKVNMLGPDLVVLDSWNDFTRGTQVAPSAQYGVVYADATRTLFTRMAARRAVQISVRRAAVPAVMMPGVPYQVQLLLRNEGFSDLKVGPQITMVYRLTNETDPKTYYKATAAEGLSLAAGQLAPVIFTVTAGKDSRSLPAGRYRLTFEVTKSSLPLFTSSWFTRQLSSVAFPVLVGQPPPLQVSVLDDGLPGSVTAGGTTPGFLRLRNDGRLAWKGMRLSYQWYLAGASASELRPASEAVLLPLPDTPPGRALIVRLQLAALAGPGQPLPPSAAASRYLVRWRLVGEGSEGMLFHSVPVTVLANSPAAQVVRAEVPPLASSAAATARIALKNTGVQAWPQGQFRLAASWLRWDGVELGAAGEAALMATPPGQPVMVNLPLQAPALPGSFRLCLFLAGPQGVPVALTSLSVPVTGGNLQAVELPANIVGSTSDRRRSSGTFDGLGRSFPCEYLPPDLSGLPNPLYPCGYGLSRASACPVPFRWPDTGSGRGGAAACRNQALSLEPGSYAEVWVVAAGTDPTTGDFGLVYADATETVSLPIASWTEPAPDAIIAAAAGHLHTVQGDEATPAYLYAYRLAADPARSLTALRLPANERIRVFAVSALRAAR